MDPVHVTREQIDRYNKPGPRYTSYPTVPVWSAQFNETDYRAALAAVAARPDETLSVYVHLPSAPSAAPTAAAMPLRRSMPMWWTLTSTGSSGS